MKLTMIILVTGFLQVSFAAHGQKVTLNEKNAKIEVILNKIGQQTGYDFLYKREWLSKIQNLDIKLNGADLTEALDLIFKNQPITYSISDETIVLKRKLASVFNEETGDRKSINLNAHISGSVIDKTGKPLVGASITFSGKKSFRATADDYGRFTVGYIPEGKYKVTVTYVGYEKQETTFEVNEANKNDNQTFDFILVESNSNLDQVQVIAYGKESRRFSVGSVSTLTAVDIEKQPVTNVLQALEGRIPGLNITSTSGIPGSAVKVQVRGQNTLASSLNQKTPYDQPLFIIDGVPVSSQNQNINQLGSLGMDLYNLSNPSGVSAFIGVNPADIESISVLKDADATSIYGSQGSNGVILITTKKGDPGKTHLNLSLNTGFNVATDVVKLLNTQQYQQLRNDAYKSDGLVPSADPTDYSAFAPDLKIFDQNKYTDWQHTIFGKTSKTTDLHLSLTGGSKNTTFLISGGYSANDYNFPGNFSNNRLSFHSTVNHTSLDNRFNISFGTDYSYSKNNSSGFGGMSKTLLPPNLPDLLDQNGDLIWDYKGINLSYYQFYSYLKQANILQNYSLNNNIHVGYKLLTGLNFGANIGYSHNNTLENQRTPVISLYPGSVSSSSFSNNTTEAINIEPQLDYSHSIGKGELTVLLGGTYKKNLQNGVQQTGNGYLNDALLGSIDGAATFTTSDASQIYKYAAVFGRIKYIYDQEYIVSLTGRRDGSSNFGPGNQFGNFGSAGLGWIFSEEKLFKKVLPFVSYAKLSGNYGTSGSDGLAPYQFQAFWQPDAYAPLFQGTRPFLPVNLYNPNYQWANKKTLNMSLDLGFFENRLLLNATHYVSREGNQLVNSSLPTQAGFLSVLENLAATVQNTGWEFNATSTNIKSKNFSWRSNFNISSNHNKLLAFPGLENSAYASYYIIGQPTSLVMGYRYKGVNAQTGLFEFYTSKGGVTSNPDSRPAALGGDQVPLADTAPKFFGGLGNDFTYKNFSLSLFFQFSKQTAPNYLRSLYGMNGTPGTATNVPLEYFNNYWKNPGDQAKYQTPTTFFYSQAGLAGLNFVQSSGVYSDDTYLRLKTLSLSYTLPDTYLRKLGITNLRVYLSGQNVLTFTNYKVGDPEQPGSYTDSFPLQRTFVCGLSFNL